MNTWDRPLWRAASRITAALSKAFPPTDTFTFPARAWQALHRLQQQHHQALSRGWWQAAEHLQQRLRTQLDWLRTDLALLEQELQQRLQPSVPLSVPLVYQELRALREEFGHLALDLRKTTLRVTTGDIVLDDLALGPFELVWNWSRLGLSRELQVLALEPRHPAERSDVTHPHVLDDVLCEGDAALPLQQALRAGRLCDHFVIVRQVLQTYNASSPYVALSDWDGVHCDACGDGVCQEDAAVCDLCGDTLCDGCTQHCDHCSRSCCVACSTPCGDCDMRHCLRCWPPSAQHRGVSCPTCVNEESEHASQTFPETPEPAAPLHPHGLGQAALAAGSG